MKWPHSKGTQKNGQGNQPQMPPIPLQDQWIQTSIWQLTWKFHKRNLSECSSFHTKKHLVSARETNDFCSHKMAKRSWKWPFQCKMVDEPLNNSPQSSSQCHCDAFGEGIWNKNWKKMGTTGSGSCSLATSATLLSLLWQWHCICSGVSRTKSKLPSFGEWRFGTQREMARSQKRWGLMSCWQDIHCWSGCSGKWHCCTQVCDVSCGYCTPQGKFFEKHNLQLTMWKRVAEKSYWLLLFWAAGVFLKVAKNGGRYAGC